MSPRNRYRPQLEQLDQRVVPAVLGSHLTGTHAINTTLTATFTPPATINGTIGSSLLRGTVSFSGAITSPPGADPTTASGPLTIHTKQGNVNTQNMVSVPSPGGHIPLIGTFTDTAVITGGTGKFKGVTGMLFLNGNYNVLTSSGTATVTGTISGAPGHHGHHHHHP
jgi:hypothetical protein